MAIPLIVLLLFSTNSYAVKCRDYEPPNGEKIIVVMGEDWAKISAPASLGGESLANLVLFAYVVIDGREEELAVPLAFTSDGGIVNSEFYFSSHWAELELHASYGENVCGPRLDYSFAK
jgi:hypothetical protein